MEREQARKGMTKVEVTKVEVEAEVGIGTKTVGTIVADRLEIATEIGTVTEIQMVGVEVTVVMIAVMGAGIGIEIKIKVGTAPPAMEIVTETEMTEIVAIPTGHPAIRAAIGVSQSGSCKRAQSTLTVYQTRLA